MRIMFISPHCLLDRSSGAALSMMTQLELLAKRGWECRALTGSVLDNKKRQNLQEALAPWGLSRIATIANTPIFGVQRNWVEHVVFLFSDTRRHYVTAVEELVFFNLVTEQLKDWKPDIVYCFGGWLLERSILALAKKKGIATAFYLANTNYEDPGGFDDVDMVLVLSEYQAGYYREKLGIAPKAIGVFADTSAVIAKRDAPDMVTFVNPAPEKGATIFMEIARMALVRIPELHFTVVESRTTAVALTEQFGIDWAEFPNVHFIPQQKDMRQVYDRTRILLCPSFCYEGAGLVIYEAQANGIPVLGSSHGAIPESLAGGGFMFDIPERCKNDFKEFPSAEEVAPWVDCLERLIKDPEFMAAAEERALSAADLHNIDRLAESLDCFFRDYLIKKLD